MREHEHSLADYLTTLPMTTVHFSLSMLVWLGLGAEGNSNLCWPYVTVYGKRGHFTQKMKLRYRLQKYSAPHYSHLTCTYLFFIICLQ